MSERYGLLAIGGGPAGLAAARGYRAAGGAGEVAIVTDEQRMPYNRPPLTKELLRGETSENDLAIEEEDWLDEQRVTIIGSRAMAIDAGAREVTLAGGRRVSYEECVLATGGEPKRLPVPGADHPRVRTVRTLDDLRELTARLQRDAPVVVVGSGFIGCEIASSLRFRGHRVRLVSDEQAPNEARLGGDAAAIIKQWLVQDGVELHLGVEVKSIEIVEHGVEVHGADGRALTGSLAVMAGGIAPRGELAGAAGIELDDNAVPVNAAMRTTIEGLLAAGDVCKADNVSAGRALRVEHWGDALAQGEIAGRNAAGQQAEWDEVPGFWSTIGGRTLKYQAWGDGFEQAELRRHDDDGFTARYGMDGKLVGVLTYEADSDYDAAAEQIKRGDPWRP